MGRYPVPSKEREMQGIGAGPLVTYKLSPEELEKYRTKGKTEEQPVLSELEIKKRIISLKLELEQERQARIQLEQELEELRKSRAKLEQELERIKQTPFENYERQGEMISGLLKAMSLLVEFEMTQLERRMRSDSGTMSM